MAGVLINGMRSFVFGHVLVSGSTEGSNKC